MGLLEVASSKSVWRGYEYYNNKNVILHTKISDTEYKGTVSGLNNTHYDVFIDIEHPRKSKCNCPHADGKRIVCKHMVALYFTLFPKFAKEYYDEVINYWEEEEKRQEEMEDKVISYVHKMKKSELEQAFLQFLFEGPEWQYERFIREYVEW